MADRIRNITLKAILFADLADYSRLVSKREAETLAFIEACFGIFRERCGEFDGIVVKTTGDGIMAEFAAVSLAVHCAVAMHQAVDALQADQAQKAQFRIGIHSGEVERIGADIYGHAVNIAARLVTLAKPGGVCVSHEVFRHARRGTPYAFAAGGVTSLRNIPDPIAIYHLVGRDQEAAQQRETERLSVHTIDGLSAINSAGEAAVLRSGHARALLGYLALSPQSGDTQDRVAALLWPEREPKVSRRALSHCVRGASLALNEVAFGVLFRRGDRIGFDTSLIEVDLTKINNSLLLGTVDDLLIERPDWPDAILFGTENVSKLYRSWLVVARHNWRTKIADALETCLHRFDAPEPAARRAASALLALDPSHEPAVQKLIQHHAANRNVTLAIKIFQEFATLLKERFQISPSAETLALVEGVVRPRAEQTPVLAPPQEPSRLLRIAFGRFDAEGVASAEAYLVAGFRNEVLANLSRFREWVVLEAQSEEAASSMALQPDYLLSALCRKARGGLRLSIMLSESRTSRVIWSDAFEISIENWFASQRGLVRKVAARLQIYVSSDRLWREISTGDTSRSDYRDWLRGEHLLSRWSPDAEDEAAAIFEGILERNPNFAPAFASRAGIYNVRHLIRPGSPLDAAQERRALPLAQRAVELDALDARNHLIMAWSSAMARAYEQASVHYELAASLNPSSPKLLVSCAQGLAFVGSKQRAGELLAEAVELAPFFLNYQWCYIASTRYMIGDYAGAIVAAQRGANATLDTPGWRAVSLARLGRLEEARGAFAEQVDLLRPAWADPGCATAAAVRDWFLSAFPIGSESDRAELRETLDALVEV